MINVRFVSAFATCVLLSGPSTVPMAQAVFPASPGANVKAMSRAFHYTRDQGSRMIALASLGELQQLYGHSFRPDGVVRYGYVPMEKPAQTLPVAPPLAEATRPPMPDIASLACPAQEIAIFGIRYNVETKTGPEDFNGRLLHVDSSLQATARDEAAFEAFSRDIIRAAPQKPDRLDDRRLRLTL